MPIFELGNKKQNINIDDPLFTQFVLANPNATTIEEYNGQQYRIKAKDYANFSERRNNRELEQAGMNPYTQRFKREYGNYAVAPNTPERYGLATRMREDMQSAQREIASGQVMPTVSRNVYLGSNNNYLTPAGHAENSIDARQDAERAYYQGVDTQLDDLFGNINDEMREVAREKTAARRAYEDDRGFWGWVRDATLAASVAELPVLQGQLVGSELEMTDRWRSLQERDDILNAAARLYNEGQRLRLSVANDQGFGEGFTQSLVGLLTNGDDRKDARLIEATVNKYKNQEPLTQEEEILLKALALNAAATDEYGEDLNIWYKVGQTTGDMIPMMLEMYSNPLSGIGKAAGRNIITRGMKNLAGGVARGYGMALTTGLPDVVRGTQERMLGDAIYRVEPNGEIKYTGQTEGADGLTAFYQSATNRMIENATEMFGAGYIGRPINWLAKTGRNTKLLGWMDNFARSKYGRQFRKFAKATKWHGPIEEFFEEMHSGIVNPILTGEGSVGDFFDGDNLATTALSVLVPGAAFATVNTAVGINNGSFKAGAQELSRMQQSEANAAVAWRNKNEEWNGFKDKIDNGSIEDVDALLREVQDRSDLTSDQKITAFRYGINNMRYRTARGVSEALNEKDKLYPMLRDIYARYYTAMPTGESALDANKELIKTEQKAKEALGLQENETIEGYMGERTVEEVANGSVVIAEALNNYLGAKAAFEGIQDRFQDARNEEYNRNDRGIDDNANNGVLYSTTYDGKNVFITSGNVILLDNGKIDYDNSSSELIVRFPDGHKKIVATEEFSEDVQVLNAEEVRAAGRAKIDEKWQAMFDNAEAKDIENEKRNSGILFELSDELGVHSIEVIEEGNDDSKILFDGKEMPIGTDELNQWRKEAGVSVSGVAPVQTNGPMIEAIPMERRGSEERAAYHLVPIERTMEDLHDGALDSNEITALIKARIKEAYNDIQTLEKSKPKEPKMPTMGASKEAYLKAKAKVKEDFARANEKWSAEMQEAKQRWEYYNELNMLENEITRSEMADNYANVKPAEVELTADEFVANLLPKITPESFKRETGLSNAEQQGLVGVIAGADKGGVSVEQAAESILENYSDELRGLGFNGDVQDVRDMIIGILSNGNPRSYAKRGLEQRSQESIDQQRAEMEAVAVQLGFESIEEMTAYEEQVVPGIIQLYTGFDYNDYYTNLAENYEYDTTRESETAGRGGELLQGEQSIDNAGDAVVAERNAGGAVSNSVQSNGENVAPQGNQEVNVPVGETEQLSSSEIPNNQSVAEGDGVDHSLSQEEAQVFITEMEANAEVAPEIELTIENWDSLFGEDGLVKTPIGEVKMGENQFTKLMRQGRDGKLGMVKPTLENPDVIIEDKSKAKNGETERPSSYVFVKSFKKADGSRYYYFTSVTVSKDGKEVIVSNQEKRRNAIANLLTNGKLVWKHADNVSNASDVANGLYSSQGNSSDLAAEGTDAPQTNVGVNETPADGSTTISPEDNNQQPADTENISALDASSASEDRNSVSNSQENTQKSGETAENGGENAKTPMQKLADRILDRAEEKRRIPLRERARELEAQVGVKANIIESLDEVKNREARERIAAGEAVAGWYSGGQVYLYMPNIKDRREIELTYVHEVVAHHGVKKLLGDRFNEFLDGVWNMMSEADRARMLAYVGANENPTLQDMRAAADEYVAELAEKMNLGELEQSTWDKIVDWFKELLENIGFENLTKEDIESMLKASYSNLKAESGKGKTGSTENDFRARMTFHGSGAKFDRFDHAFMGTGEGAQAFGWGTYVTEVEGIGKQYANATSKPNLTYKGQEVDVEGFENPWRLINDLYEDTRGKLSEMRAKAERYEGLAEEDSLMKPVWKEVVRILKEARRGDLKASPRRVLYTVDIPDDNGSNYLHWEEVVPSNVVNAVKQRLFDELAKGDYKGVEKELKRELDDVFKYSDNEGYSLYGNISAYLGGGKVASQFLNEMGFVGISYPADSGRADGARNYVIFNENDAEIKDRTMFRKRDSERRQEKRRINNIIDTAAGFVTVGGKKQATKNRLKKEAERKQLAKEMYSSVLKGDFNDVTLSQIDKFIEDATPANPFGRRISQRLPQRMERALHQRARTNAVDALFSRICESAVPANERFSEAGRREIEERKKELLKGWAIATGNWYTDLKEFTNDTEPIGEGKDSKVYMSKDGNSVIKASKGKPFGKKFRPDIDNIALFNDVFKNSRYEILGYGEIDGQFVRILKQDFIDFAKSTPLTPEERVKYMDKLGFKPLNKDYTAFSNGEIVIADLQKSNIVKDAAGNISVIDADAKLHTKDVGGDYTYPPVEEDLPEDSGTRFRIANENQEIFVSNARKAVEEIKQDKATPQQWLAMIKKNGGLKAGEDKWMGLSEWLENNESKSLTKQEVLDFVNENAIKIEEVRYSQFGYGMLDEAVKKLEAETKEIGWDAMQEKYSGIEEYFEYYNGEVLWNTTMASIGEYEDFVLDNKIVYANPTDNAINESRESYTTEGLERKREIALVVPTIEPYNQSDEIHFGDAGNGRAVAWVRFGETTADTDKTIAAKKAVNDYLAEMREKYNTLEGEETDAMTAEEIERLQELTAKEIESGEKKARVLVIDEIQSKRHQDAREKGYKDTRAYEREKSALDEKAQELFQRRKELIELLNSKYGSFTNYLKHVESSGVSSLIPNEDVMTPEEIKEYNETSQEGIIKEEAELRKKYRDGVPEAPFEKNWQELAMKRMLRLAAEEGFDKVAWTTGEQQAERYNLGQKIERIVKDDDFSYQVYPSNGIMQSLEFDEDGIYRDEDDAELNNKSMSDIFGKELAGKLKSMPVGEEFSGGGLRIGGEGMKGFYDKMLPSFVQKYTKKWGAKVGTVEMPNLEQNNVMHSVDVTPEMKESVMEGQTMFRVVTHEEAVQIANDFANTHKGATKKVVFSKGKETLEQQMRDAGFTDFSIEVALKNYEGEENLTDGAYYVSSDGIVLYEYKTEEEVNKILWHENTHRAITKLFGEDLTKIEEVYNGLPDSEKSNIIKSLEEKNYDAEDFPAESMCYFVEEAYLNKFLNSKYKLSYIVEKVNPEMKDFANFVQELIDYIDYGREGIERVGREGTKNAGELYIEQQLQERNGESDANGEGTDATEGATGSYDNGREDTRFRSTGETIENQEVAEGAIDDVKTAPLTLMERITNSLLEVSAKNKENLELRADALRTYGRDLKDILKLMRAQREYDKSTVDALVKLAKMFFKNAQLMGEVSTYEVGRILGVINNVVGRKDIADNAEKLMDILVDAHNKALGSVLEKAEKVKLKKVNAAGVEVIGALDKFGQEMVAAYNAGKELSGKPLNDAVSEAYNNLAEADEKVKRVFGLDAEADVERFVNGYTPTGEEQKDAVIEGYKYERATVQGYELAREFVENIKGAKAEIEDLEKELKKAYQAKREGVMSQEAYNELRRSTINAILESKIDMVDAYHSLISKFSEGVRESGKRAKAFQQAQIDRVKQIQHNANSDLEGHPAIVQGEKPTKNNDALIRTLMASQPTLQTMLKKFGEKAVDGRGYLYDRFMGQATMASHNEFQGVVAARVMIETKLKEIYGDSYGIADFVKDSNKPGIVIEYKEGVNTKKFELTRGQMLYICMVDKMSDGQMKLRRMGITEETVNEIRSKLPEEMTGFADWVQNDLMNTLRNKYNAVHEKLFGAPMAAIENYFPIKIRKEAVGDKKELGQDAEAKPSTVTGAVIKRTKNSLALDLSADAMQVLLDHIDQMEHWAAFAEFNRDMNSLLNYRHFQNQVKGMTTLRFGSGDMLWKKFEDVVNIATENYRPTRSEIDKAVLNMTKAITRSKINFRFYTALKQILSAPAFWNEAGVIELVEANFSPKESIVWAYNNLPGYKERWEGRTMGNEKLLAESSDWKVFKNKFVEGATKWGMTPNAAVDAYTVAVGARAVYLTKLKQFKNAGYSEEMAEKKALQRAAEAYNESQQSSEGAYLSPMQVSGTAMAAIFTTFKNSNFGYTRKTAQAVANILHKTKAGYKEETIAFMAKKMMREGLGEQEAKKYAEKLYYKSIYKDVVDVALFGAGLGLLWNMGGMALYLIFGDDDEEKAKMWEEIAFRGALDALNGIPLGDMAIDLALNTKEGDVRNFKSPELMLFTDLKNVVKAFNSDAVKGANDLINMLVAAGVGVDAKTLTDVLVAIGDVENWADTEELGLFALRFLSAPQSQLDRLMVDDAMENGAENLGEVAQRYMEYKKGKDTPLTGWLYSDEGERKALEKYGERFARFLDERMEWLVEENDEFDVFYNSADAETKKVLASMRHKFLAGEEAEKYQKFSAFNLIKGILTNEGIDGTEYFDLTNADDVDADFVFVSTMKDLQGVKKDFDESDNKGEFYNNHKRELDLYVELNRIKRYISNNKKDMQEHPENARERMDTIRELRTRAIELINDYNNE